MNYTQTEFSPRFEKFRGRTQNRNKIRVSVPHQQNFLEQPSEPTEAHNRQSSQNVNDGGAIHVHISMSFTTRGFYHRRRKRDDSRRRNNLPRENFPREGSVDSRTRLWVSGLPEDGGTLSPLPGSDKTEHMYFAASQAVVSVVPLSRSTFPEKVAVPDTRRLILRCVSLSFSTSAVRGRGGFLALEKLAIKYRSPLGDISGPA